MEKVALEFARLIMRKVRKVTDLDQETVQTPSQAEANIASQL